MQVSGTTSLYGILGWPVAHSLSPRMHNAAFAALGLDAVYVPFAVAPENLEQAISGWRALGVKGGNVTIPHKEAVCAWLDEIDPDAQLIGAVNTIVRRDERLIGYNTDGEGLVASLVKDLDCRVAAKRVLVLGAGGAARSILVALARRGAAQILVANRSLSRAGALCQRYAAHFPDVDFSPLELDAHSLGEVFPQIDVLINTTSIGLHGESFNVLPWRTLNVSARVYDAVYSPQQTPLVHQALSYGFRACDGLGMLIAQGEVAFRLWTGRDPGRFLEQALARH
ncbi:MAG: shikimate dehydrogenase [Desulfuromonadaceae bacterium]|nr:shikimate dehydrogenase [Desulfuromonadaceae bacterium]